MSVQQVASQTAWHQAQARLLAHEHAHIRQCPLYEWWRGHDEYDLIAEVDARSGARR